MILAAKLRNYSELNKQRNERNKYQQKHVRKLVNETHATETCYALATLVTEQDGKDVLTTHAVRYYDKYVKIDGRRAKVSWSA